MMIYLGNGYGSVYILLVGVLFVLQTFLWLSVILVLRNGSLSDSDDTEAHKAGILDPLHEDRGNQIRNFNSFLPF